MQLGNFLKVPVVYFFEDYPVYEGASDKVHLLHMKI